MTHTSTKKRIFVSLILAVIMLISTVLTLSGCNTDYTYDIKRFVGEYKRFLPNCYESIEIKNVATQETIDSGLGYISSIDENGYYYEDKHTEFKFDTNLAKVLNDCLTQLSGTVELSEEEITFKNPDISFDIERSYYTDSGMHIEGTCFQNNCEYIRPVQNSATISCQVNGDDNITKIIPVQLFTEESSFLNCLQNLSNKSYHNGKLTYIYNLPPAESRFFLIRQKIKKNLFICHI